jgi:Tfp pilus assembly protein PilF
MEWALHNLGLLYADQGKLAEAETMYTRALQGFINSSIFTIA